jgi:hypothetical protein
MSHLLNELSAPPPPPGESCNKRRRRGAERSKEAPKAKRAARAKSRRNSSPFFENDKLQTGSLTTTDTASTQGTRMAARHTGSGSSSYCNYDRRPRPHSTQLSILPFAASAAHDPGEQNDRALRRTCPPVAAPPALQRYAFSLRLRTITSPHSRVGHALPTHTRKRTLCKTPVMYKRGPL